MQNKEKLLFFMLIGVVTLWGLNVVMVKYLATFPPLYVAAIRMTVAGVCLAPIIYKYKTNLRLKKGDWLLIAGVGASSIALHQITLAAGVQTTTAGNASLILGLNPLATALLAMIFLGEAMSWQKGLGIGVGFAGVLIVVISQHGGFHMNGWGDAIMFFSMLMYVTGGLLIRKLVVRGVPVLLITALSQMFGIVFLWAAALVQQPASYYFSLEVSPFQWLVIFVSGALSTALGSVGWNYGIRQLGASRTAVFLNGMPMASLLFAALFLGEQLKLVHVLAMFMIVGGVYLGSRNLVKPTPVPSKAAPELTTKA
ncbi:DMT family transporter [Brevibacillus agri]|uniref:DMT family transporter n=1 Tax=Brevibacillus agri TaxID=51101 RepID=UPI002E1B9C13|nr:DMT family transporter [Brevibacillus agri]MED1653380.1 DMT family transporter [Brevibacillus agri]MED1685965.1 DMT family transporter [Brevibacillus agri]MED1692396.1 DMT family transporter [Brevibacillus agri]MED1698583.1 DMT family transporter [Brevibacillus agri]